MRFAAPRWLRDYSKRMLAPLLDAADGSRMVKLVKAIVKTDRWNSFDRFHETTRTLVDAHEAAGAGRIGLRQMGHTHRASYTHFRVWQVVARDVRE